LGLSSKHLLSFLSFLPHKVGHALSLIRVLLANLIFKVVEFLESFHLFNVFLLLLQNVSVKIKALTASFHLQGR
jgi:hypothetical protein